MASAQDTSLFEQAFKKLSLNERKSIQSELADYGAFAGGIGYNGTIDGLWGRNTANAIVGAYKDTFQYFPKDMWDTEAQFLNYILEPYEFWGEGGECDGCGESEEIVEADEKIVPHPSKSAAQQLLSQSNAIKTMECTVISTEGILQVGLSIFDDDTVEYRQDGMAVKMSRGAGNGTFDSEGSRYVVDISDPRGLPILVLFNTASQSVQFNVMGGLLVHNGRCD